MAPIAAAVRSTASGQRSRARPVPHRATASTAPPTTSAPSPSPIHQRSVYSGQAAPSPSSSALTQPIVPPSSGASATGRARKASRSVRRLRSGSRPRQAHSSSVAPASASPTFAAAQPSAGAMSLPWARSTASSAVHAPATTYGHALRGVSTSAESVTPAAGKKTG